MKKLTVLVPILALITAIVMSCGEEPRHRGITDENQRTHVDSVIFSAFDTRDIPRTLAVIDSVEKKGELSKVRGLFYRTLLQAGRCQRQRTGRSGRLRVL